MMIRHKLAYLFAELAGGAYMHPAVADKFTEAVNAETAGLHVLLQDRERLAQENARLRLALSRYEDPDAEPPPSPPAQPCTRH